MRGTGILVSFFLFGLITCENSPPGGAIFDITREKIISGRTTGTAPSTVCPPPASTIRAEAVLSTAAAGVTVSLGAKSSLPQLERKRFGGYSMEQTDWQDRIYDPTHTLKPLQQASYRIQLSVQDAELDEQGYFVDRYGTQLGIIQRVSESVTKDIFITVGYPWSSRAQQFVKDGFPADWKDYWWNCYSSVADKLASPPYWTGKTFYINIFGEPDFSLWSWVYGTERWRIFEAIKLAHDAFARYPDRFKIGCCGLAFPEGEWASAFLDWYKEQARVAGMHLDFISYQTFLNWGDATVPAQYETFSANSVINVHWRNEVFLKVLRDKGLHDLAANIVVSETAWTDPDLVCACGFGADPVKNARFSLTQWKSAARTLHAMDLFLNEPSITRVYWAQGAGMIQTPGRDRPDLPELTALYAYLPYVVFDQLNHENQFQSHWHYKASYYAFWMYGQMKGARAVVRVSTPDIGVWASRTLGKAWLTLWNKSNTPRLVTLRLRGAKSTCPCTMYLVDDTTYTVAADSGSIEAVISGPTSPTPPVVAAVRTVGDALRYMRTRSLGGEASVMLAMGRRC